MDVTPYRVATDAAIDLHSFPTRHEFGGAPKRLRKALACQRRRIRTMQERLFASATASLLLVFQGLDAAGKDGAIRAVLNGVNPQGISVTSFREPQGEELAHSWLRRHWLALPARGRIAVFNRSHYEEVLMVRVHPELLAARRLPQPPDEGFWNARLDDICAFERHLARNGTHIAKFYLHVSEEEQRRRILRRLADPARQWKFQPSDLTETRFREDHLRAAEAALATTATPEAPWLVVPADHKPTARLIVATAIADTLAAMAPELPAPSAETKQAIADLHDYLEEPKRGRPNP